MLFLDGRIHRFDGDAVLFSGSLDVRLRVGVRHRNASSLNLSLLHGDTRCGGGCVCGLIGFRDFVLGGGGRRASGVVGGILKAFKNFAHLPGVNAVVDHLPGSRRTGQHIVFYPLV